MKNWSFLGAATVIFIVGGSIFAAENVDELTRQAVSSDAANSGAAIRSLREMGQPGLDALLKVYDSDIERYKLTGKADQNWKFIAHAIDQVAMQKDDYASQLYWYTDLDQALLMAKASGKPVLSLRLLGNLNEEFSCANSRFFRAVLYSNAAISEDLRNNYVLHWQSVRPAPRVTIDFGDGRKIERTLTGNSIHYVLDSGGRVMDALPGLNSPERFLRFLSSSSYMAKMSATDAAPVTDGISLNTAAMLQDQRVREYRVAYSQINSIGTQLGLKFDTTKKPGRPFEEMPPAMLAASLAMVKSMSEVRILKNITPDMTQYGGEQVDLEQWKKIAQLANIRSKLDNRSIAFIRRQTAPNNLTATQFSKLIQNLETYIAIDTARNEFLMRCTLLTWLNKGLDKDLNALNSRVYSEMFQTPNEDNWLGLYAPDLYTALDGNGIVK